MTLGDEARAFLGMVLAGALLGPLFDSHRAWHRKVRPRPGCAAVADLIVWLGAATLAVAAMIAFNGGSLRGYIFLGMAIGAVVYWVMAHPAVGALLEAFWGGIDHCRRRLMSRRVKKQSHHPPQEGISAPP